MLEYQRQDASLTLGDGPAQYDAGRDGLIGGRGISKAAGSGISAAPRILWRARRMRKRWPGSGFEAYLGVPLGEIRREFGIRLLPR